MTQRWRDMDSNPRSPVSGAAPQRPRIASPGIISAKSRLALRTKGFDPFAEILRASPESHRFLAKVPAPRRRDPPVPGFRKMRVQASGNSYLHGHRWGLGEQKANQAPESHRFLAKVPAPRRRDTPLPAFRKMRVQASGNSFPAYQKRGEPNRRQMADMIIMPAVEALIIIMPATRESSEDLREGLEAFGAK